MDETIRLIKHVLESCWVSEPSGKKTFDRYVAIKNVEAALELIKQINKLEEEKSDEDWNYTTGSRYVEDHRGKMKFILDGWECPNCESIWVRLDKPGKDDECLICGFKKST